MEFKITFGENFPCLVESLPRIDANLILEDSTRFDNDYVVNGLIEKISHPGGVDRVVFEKENIGFYESEPKPESTNKLKVLLQVLRDEFTLTQENGGLILYMEERQSAGRDLPYYAVILPFENVAMVVCNKYGQGTRIKKYDSKVTPDYVRNEIQDNYRKGDLDNVGFTMNSVPAGGYEDDAILYQYFTSLIKDDVARIETICSARAEMVDAVLNADPETFTGFNEVVECDDNINLNQLKSQLRDRFNGEDGVLDLSKITRNNILALKKEYGIGPDAIAARLNIELPGDVRVGNPSCFAYVLLRVYDSFEGCDRCEESIRKLNVLTEPECLKAALRDYFNGDDGVLDLSNIIAKNIRALKKEFGIGPASIATRLNIELPEMMTVKNPSGFLYVLLSVYQSSKSYAGCVESIRKLNILIYPECLKAALRNYFNGEDGVLGVSKITAKNIRPLKKEFGVGPDEIANRLNVELPEDFNVQTPSGFPMVLLEVYRASESYAGCNESIRKLNVLTDTECLKAALRNYFNGDDGVLDLSNIIAKNIRALKKEFGIRPASIAARLNIELPDGVYAFTPSVFVRVLKVVYESSENYAGCEQGQIRLNQIAVRLGVGEVFGSEQ